MAIACRHPPLHSAFECATVARPGLTLRLFRQREPSQVPEFRSQRERSRPDCGVQG